MLHPRPGADPSVDLSSYQSPPLPAPKSATSNVPSSCVRNVPEKRSNSWNVPNSITQIPFPSHLLLLLPYLPLQGFTIASEVALPPVRSPPDSPRFPPPLLNLSQLPLFLPQTRMIPPTRCLTGLSVSLHLPVNHCDISIQSPPDPGVSLSSGQ